MTVDDELARALAAVQSGELRTALDALLAAWRLAPLAMIGDAIDVVGRAAARAIAAPTGDTPKQRRAAWEALAGMHDPRAMAVLLATIVETRFAQTWERFEVLGHADPRVDHRIADLLEAPVFTPHTNEPLWKAMFAALIASPDPRIDTRMHGFEAKWSANRALTPWRMRIQHEQLTRFLRGARKPVAKPTPKQRAACSAIAAALPAAPVAGDEPLLAAIYEHPADDGPRAVYMDWLLERGDPRGELLALQLARARGEPGDPRREEKLLTRYGTQWLGSLADKLRAWSFARGFLDTCELRPPLAELDADPAWGTARVVAGGVPAHDGCSVRALRELEDIADDGIIRLAALREPLRVERLAWAGPDEWKADALAGFAQIRVLPVLRVLELRGYAWQWPIPTVQLPHLLDAPAAAKVAELAVAAAFGRAPDVLGLVPDRIRRLELVAGSGSMWAQSWRAVFTRNPTGAFTRVRFVGTHRHYKSAIHVTYGHETLDALNAFAPDWFEVVDVAIVPEARAAFQDQLKRPLAAALKRHRGARYTLSTG